MFHNRIISFIVLSNVFLASSLLAGPSSPAFDTALYRGEALHFVAQNISHEQKESFELCINKLGGYLASLWLIENKAAIYSELVDVHITVLKEDTPLVSEILDAYRNLMHRIYEAAMEQQTIQTYSSFLKGHSFRQEAQALTQALIEELKNPSEDPVKKQKKRRKRSGLYGRRSKAHRLQTKWPTKKKRPTIAGLSN